MTRRQRRDGTGWYLLFSIIGLYWLITLTAMIGWLTQQ